MSAPGKLVRSSRWKSGPSKGQRPLGSECCVAPGDSGHEAYTAIAWGVGLSHETSDIAGAEGFHSLEGNMCGTDMRGADALPGQMLTDLIGGQLQVGFTGISSSLENIRAGKLRALAIAGAERFEPLPDLPTIGESVPGYEASGWCGVVAPKNTPSEVIEKLYDEINAGLADRKFK